MTLLFVLGSGQDAGIPHTGCDCNICDKARSDDELKRLGSSIAVLDEKEGHCYIIDASPDFKMQLDMIHEDFKAMERKRRILLNGIFLTHAHFGHVSGLWQLGMEAMNVEELPIYCTKAMAQFLRSNHPFQFLVDRKNIDVREIGKDEEIQLEGFKCMTMEVPHRNEIADTIGYIVESKKRVLYIPDLDCWTDEILAEVRKSDIALIDGTFYSRDEIDRYDEIKHPTIEETIERLRSPKGTIYFTHINHTNPVNEKGKERRFAESKGFKICNDGLTLEI